MKDSLLLDYEAYSESFHSRTNCFYPINIILSVIRTKP